MSAPETRQHETVIEIPATVEEVWKAITEAGEIQRWFAPEVRTDAREGGEYFLSWGPGMEGGGTIEIFDAPHHLRLVQKRGKIVQDYYIEAKGGITVLRLVHSGFLTTAEWDNEYNGTKSGWPMYFRILRHAITRHRGAVAHNMDLYAMSDEPIERVEEKVAAFGPGGAMWWIWPEKNDAIVHVATMPMGPKTMVWMNISTYGLSEEQAAGVRKEWSEKLDRAFPAAASETCHA
jgi:hypothetical protein